MWRRAPRICFSITVSDIIENLKLQLNVLNLINELSSFSTIRSKLKNV